MLDSYYLLNQKIKKHIIMFPIIVIIIFAILLLLLYKVKVPIYLEGTATIEYNTDILLKIYIPLNKLNFIEKNTQIILNEKEYNYQIKEIEKNRKQEAKVTVYLSLNLDKDIIKNNTIVKYKIEIDKMTLPDRLTKK